MKMNYRREREHDELLIKLVTELESGNRLDLLGSALKIDVGLGNLEHTCHRQPFDVELTFSNLSIVIETKVDSDEDGRFEDEKQTERIARKSDTYEYLNEEKEFRFITYGTSEFYTKPFETGPGSSEFQHVGLEDMIALVEEAERVLSPCKYRQEWLRLMRIEKEKRSNAVELLQSFSRFRTEYLKIHGENDFPRNRLLFCVPELAFPVLGSLTQEWNNSEYKDRFGQVSLYPVNRLTPPVHDSILNFWEMWQDKNPKLPILGKTILGSEDGGFYLEINEDFNLNLKIEEEVAVDDDTKNSVWECLEGTDWPPFVEKCPRDYRQTVVVLYEIDFGLLEELSDMRQVIKNLADTLEVLIRALGD